MTQYKDIPQATDQRNVSQGDLRNNFNYLCTPISGGTGTPGILPVDHQATGDNTVNPADGFHKQVSFLNQTAPASLVNAINGQSSNGILYESSGKLSFYDGTIHYPLTNNVPVSAAVIFDGAGNILNAGNAKFNVTTVTVTAVPSYIINFTTPLSSNFYYWQINGFINAGTAITGIPRPSAVYSTYITTNSIEIVFLNPAGTLVSNLVAANIIIFGG